MIDREANLYNKILFNPDDGTLIKIINQNSHWYTIKRLSVKGCANEYIERKDVLNLFEIIPSESSTDEWDVFMRKAGYTESQIDFLKNEDKIELAESFMPRNRPYPRIPGDESWDY